MIQNERQYQLTKAQVARFEQAAKELVSQPASEDIHPVLQNAERAAMEGQLDDLRTQLWEYEALRSGAKNTIELSAMEELPRVLIQARIASGLTQKQLAERLSLKEQQIQRYEAGGYTSASLSRVSDVIRALKASAHGVVSVAPNLSPRETLKRLGALGIDSALLADRIAPAQAVEALRDPNASDDDLAQALRESLLGITRVFGVGLADLLKPGEASLRSAVPARFKLPARVRESYLSAYTAYAYYLASTVSRCTQHLEKRQITRDAQELHRTLLVDFGSVSFSSVLSYAWGNGTSVVPLRDRGAFHGACWRVAGRNVIVLKQQTASQSRLMFDLLHELWHAGEPTEDTEFGHVEAADTDASKFANAEERAASTFAGNVALGGRAEELAQACIKQANGRLEFLKKACQVVAKRENAAVEALANYLAFRLSLDGVNWWGAAQNLQSKNEDPWKDALALLIHNCRPSELDELDRSIVARALELEEV